MINWTWIGQRLRMIGACPHEWMVAEGRGRQACWKCGTWRWFPILRRHHG